VGSSTPCEEGRFHSPVQCDVPVDVGCAHAARAPTPVCRDGAHLTATGRPQTQVRDSESRLRTVKVEVQARRLKWALTQVNRAGLLNVRNVEVGAFVLFPHISQHVIEDERHTTSRNVRPPSGLGRKGGACLPLTWSRPVCGHPQVVRPRDQPTHDNPETGAKQAATGPFLGRRLDRLENSVRPFFVTTEEVRAIAGSADVATSEESCTVPDCSTRFKSSCNGAIRSPSSGCGLWRKWHGRRSGDNDTTSPDRRP
jgi:hypothetical protein